MKNVLLVLTFLFAIPTFATDFPVHNGGDLQSALTSAAAAGVGSTVTIDAGATVSSTGYFINAVSGCTAGQYVTVRTSAFASLPTGRVSPSNASLLAKVVTTSGASTFNLGIGAGCWKLLGLEITDNTTSQVQVMVAINNGSDIVVDRCFIHPAEYPNNTPPYNTTGRFAIQANSARVSLTNNYIDGFWGLPPGGVAGNTAVDANCIVMDGGPGPITIQNNYGSCWFDNMLFGGADPPPSLVATVSASPVPTMTTATLSTVSGLANGMLIAIALPGNNAYCQNGTLRTCFGNGKITNIVGTAITYTHLQCVPFAGTATRSNCPDTVTPLSGGGSAAQWQGSQVGGVTVLQNTWDKNAAFSAWQHTNNGANPKGIYEVKNANGFEFGGNITTGYPANLSVLGNNQNGGAPWVTVDGINIHDNVVNAWCNFVVLMQDNEGYYMTTPPVGTWTLTDNLFIGATNSCGTDPIFMSGSGGKTFSVTHNTETAGLVVGSSDVYTIKSFDWANRADDIRPSVTFQNNIFSNGNYGFTCEDTGGNDPAGCWPSYVSGKNMIALNVNPPNSSVGSFMTSTISLASWAAALFTDTVNGNWSLQAGSPGHLAGTDGLDVGVKWNTLCSALSNDGPKPAGCTGGGPTVYNVTFNSTNPSSGVTITYSPADNNSNTSCVTGSTCALVPFNAGAAETFTVPTTASGNTLVSITGCDSVSGNLCSKVINSSVTLAGNYQVTTYSVSIGSTTPSSGVTVALSPADNGGHSTCITPCSGLSYNAGVSFGATVSATNFVNWTSCSAAAANVCNVSAISSNQSFTANYTTPPPPTFTLAVQSTNPASGTTILCAPSDTGGHGSVVTPGSLVYTAMTVTCTAPATSAGSTFVSWAGCDSSTTVTCTINIAGNRTITANYLLPGPVGPTVPPGKIPLTVTAANALVTLTPADANGVNSGTSFALTATSYSIGVKFPENGSCITPQSHNKQVWTCSWKIISGTQTQCTCQ